MKLKIILPKVSTKTGRGYLKIAIQVEKGSCTFISTNLYLKREQFDKKNEIVKDHCKEAEKYNAQLLSQKERYLSYIEEMTEESFKTDAEKLKYNLLMYDRIRTNDSTKLLPNFIKVIDKIIYDLESVATSEDANKRIYIKLFKNTRSLLIDFFRTDIILFNSINDYTLKRLKRFYAKGNYRPVFTSHLFIIKRVFKKAMKQELITSDIYPFETPWIQRNYPNKMKYLNTKILRKFHKTTGIHRDIFFLSFFLCGISTRDLFHMPYFEEYIDIKRFETTKTIATRLGLKLQPEALEIIAKYADIDKEKLIIATTLSTDNYARLINHQINKAIKIMNKSNIVPSFTKNHIRYSWATIALELGIADTIVYQVIKQTVSSQISEECHNHNYSLIDEANRKVIDYVLEKNSPQE